MFKVLRPRCASLVGLNVAHGTTVSKITDSTHLELQIAGAKSELQQTTYQAKFFPVGMRFYSVRKTNILQGKARIKNFNCH